VVASCVGGLPEVIEHGVSGFLHPPDAIEDMAASAVALLTDRGLNRRIGEAACRRVRDTFCAERVVPMYEACYQEIVAGTSGKHA
jgi:glycosyltransferase involved in cell wall biosynthesis